MKTQDFIKSIQTIYNSSVWDAIIDNTNSQRRADIQKSLEMLNSKKLGYNTLSLLIDTHYYEVLDFIITETADLETEELLEQHFNLEFAKRLAPFVVKHLLKRYVKVSGKDFRCKKKSNIVLNIDLNNVVYFIETNGKQK